MPSPFAPPPSPHYRSPLTCPVRTATAHGVLRRGAIAVAWRCVVERTAAPVRGEAEDVLRCGAHLRTFPCANGELWQPRGERGAAAAAAGEGGGCSTVSGGSGARMGRGGGGGARMGIMIFVSQKSNICQTFASQMRNVCIKSVESNHTATAAFAQVLDFFGRTR